LADGRSRGRNTLLFWASAGGVVGGSIKATAVPDLFSLGGFFNLSGLASTSLFGPNYAIARAIYFRKIGRGGEGFFEFPAYIGMSLELGNIWQQRSDISFGSARKDASLFLAFDTFLGPVIWVPATIPRGIARTICSSVELFRRLRAEFPGSRRPR